ncbi:hypothetical protein D3C73_1183620 [compost metagenome]
MLNTMKAVTRVRAPERRSSVRSTPPLSLPWCNAQNVRPATAAAARSNSGCISTDMNAVPGPSTCMELMSVFMYMRESPTPSTDNHNHGVVKVASSCMPRSPCCVRKFSNLGTAPTAAASPTTAAVVAIPAATTCRRFLTTANRASITAAGQTLTQVATLRRTDATNGRVTP